MFFLVIYCIWVLRYQNIFAWIKICIQKHFEQPRKMKQKSYNKKITFFLILYYVDKLFIDKCDQTSMHNYKMDAWQLWLSSFCWITITRCEPYYDQFWLTQRTFNLDHIDIPPSLVTLGAGLIHKTVSTVQDRKVQEKTEVYWREIDG